MSSSKVEHKQFVKENIEVRFSQEVLDKFKKITQRYPEGRQKSALLPILHIAQEESGGYLSVDVMDYVANFLNIQPIEVYEVATFYTQYYLEKQGKFVIEICRTGPCAICGGERISDYLQKKLAVGLDETTADGLFTIKEVECLGACGSAPVMQVNTEFYEFLTEAKIDSVIEDLKSKANFEQAKEEKWTERFF
jgi:NADH-quinone oxidoreductase subunit E